MTNSTKICIDANIVVRFLVPDSSPGILNLWAEWKRLQTPLYAPPLLQYEVSNALYQMTRHNLIDTVVAGQAIQAMLSLPIEFINHHEAHVRSVELASKFGIRASYDAHYLALSQHLGCELWTTDKRFFNAVHAHCDWVHLADET